MTSRPILRFGSKGIDVTDVQRCLNAFPIDGDFGRTTEHAVIAFQSDQGLTTDGIVGPMTWAKLTEMFALPPYPPPLLSPLPQSRIDEVLAIVAESPVPNYSWRDRGRAPIGYVRGMALGWTTVVRKHILQYPVALEMAQRNRDRPDTDALSWYADIFASARMNNDRDSIDTLRHLWTLIFGLGMRESSGKYCEGRDMSASNVTADTAEAGAWQMSWDARGCSEYMQRLMDEWAQPAAESASYREIFAQSVTCDESDWRSYGSGPGADYQNQAKRVPQFAAETCAIGLRHLRKHWGPINRKEVQVMSIVDDLLLQIQESVTSPEA